jgi:hypothetical protein
MSFETPTRSTVYRANLDTTEVVRITPFVSGGGAGRRSRDDDDDTALPARRRQKGILDEFDVVDPEANSSLQILNHGSAAELLLRHGVFNLSLASSLYDPAKGYPNGLVTNIQHNFAGILFPMSGNKMFSMRSLMNRQGDYDASLWKPFFNHRMKRGTTRNYEGSNTSSSFCWIDLALHTPKELIPEADHWGHELMLDALSVDSPLNEFTTRQPDGRVMLRCRITSPMTLNFQRMLNGEDYSKIIGEGSIPIFFLLGMIIQRTAFGYILSTQDKGMKKSEVVLAGKIDCNTRKFLPL